jgi:hypothetical protein
VALDKASFTYEQTLHVIETNYFFLSLSHTSSSSSSLSPIFFLSLPGRGRPLRLAAPPQLSEQAWGLATKACVASGACGEARPRGGAQADGNSLVAERTLRAESEPAAAHSRWSAPWDSTPLLRRRGSVGEGHRSGGWPEVRGAGEEMVGCRRGSGRERERRTEKKKANRYLHNQWQLGNFVTQKPVKAGRDGTFYLY